MSTMTVLRTAVAVTAAFSLAGLACGTALAADAGQARPSAASAACQPGTLKATTTDLDTRQAEMNHAGTYLKVTNTGDTTCAISGYAGLALETAGHGSATTRVKHGDTYFAQDPGERSVTLEAGDSAYADLVWTHTGADEVHAGYLQISPTGGNAHSTVAFEQDVDNGDLSLTAWEDTAFTA
ncbi:DUF4232 domain-containing protein [Streptomyces sp. CWNU-52B]|uniref:DUF4232 domain-containing protein n=1 Tax=unclassified Streptomyces TaxID=2593676 RepID=UPI0039BEE504